MGLLDKPKSVRERWFRMKLAKALNPIVKRITRRYLRVKLTLSAKKKFKLLEDALKASVFQLERFDDSKFESLGIFLNIAVFFLLAERDMQNMKIDALTHSNPSKRNLSLRVMLLVIHEWDMSKVAPANRMNSAYKKAGISETLQKEMNLSLRELNRTQKKAKKLLSSARHATIAHRESQALEQYKIITNLNTLETSRIIASFYKSSERFQSALFQILGESSSVSSLLRQHLSHT